MVKFGGEIGTLYQIFTPCTPLPKKKADGDKEGENNEVEAVAEQEIVQDTYFTFQLYLCI